VTAVAVVTAVIAMIAVTAGLSHDRNQRGGGEGRLRGCPARLDVTYRILAFLQK
jgi:hypothetical protein